MKTAIVICEIISVSNNLNIFDICPYIGAQMSWYLFIKHKHNIIILKKWLHHVANVQHSLNSFI